MNFSFILLIIIFFATHANSNTVFNTTELIRQMGYPAEDHDVFTDDGYILSVQRIPAHKPGRPVVFLQHGLLDSSATWALNFPNQSLAFILFDAGYDVWLGNVRGNAYGLRHKSLNTSQDEFWNFSWDEISKYDLIAMIDYALKTSNQETLFYVGHSQGSLILFAQLSKNRELASKIRLFIALGPVAKVDYIESPIKLLAELGKATDELFLYEILGRKEFLPSSSVIKWLGKKCNLPIFGKEICENIIFVLCGPSRFFNVSRLSFYVVN